MSCQVFIILLLLDFYDYFVVVKETCFKSSLVYTKLYNNLNITTFVKRKVDIVSYKLQE